MTSKQQKTVKYGNRPDSLDLSPPTNLEFMNQMLNLENLKNPICFSATAYRLMMNDIN